MSEWIEICALEEIPPLGARVVATAEGNVALFRAAGDEIFALKDECPHKKGPLSQGIVHGKRVTCPLHNWVLELENGAAIAPDTGCATTYAVRIENGAVQLSLPADAAGPMRLVAIEGGRAADRPPVKETVNE